MIKFQEEISKFIEGNSLRTLPHFTILVGEKGCGRHTLCNHISNSYNVVIKDISENITLETIQEIEDTAESYLYLIDGERIEQKQQNVLLKTLEETPPNAWFIYLCETEEQLIPTVRSRGYVIRFKPYTREQLSVFNDSNNPKVIQYASTPGQVIKWQNENIEEVASLASKIIKYYDKANLSNLLSISNKVAFKEELDRVDVDLLLRILTCQLSQLICESASESLFRIYSNVRNISNTLHRGNKDKLSLFENFLCKLKEGQAWI